MKKRVIKKCMNLIKKYQNYDDKKLAEIEYGLTGIYLTISKLLIIFILSIILGIFSNVIIFFIIYGLLRTFSFGIHATKSWICFVSSTSFFVGIPLICMYININSIVKIILGIICILLIFKNSPADTKKRPIVQPKRRLFYKLTTTIISITYVILSFIVTNNFLVNCFICALILQNILISPLTYRLFHQPYNNYKSFLKLHPDFLN